MRAVLPAVVSGVRVAIGILQFHAKGEKMFGSLISAGAGLIGGLLGKSGAEDAAKKNAKLQREFAQNSIRWRVEDAQKAGIHPLYGLGAPTISASPSFVNANEGLANAFGSAGQDISRAIDATRGAGEKVTAFQTTMQNLQLQRLGLENELLAAQIAKVRQAGSVPAMPSAPGDNYLIEGQGQTNNPVTTLPMERTASNPSAPFAEPGAINDVGYGRTPTGLAIVPSQDMKQRIDDDLIGTINWHLRNRLVPPSADHIPAAPGSRWVWNPFRQEYQMVRIGSLSEAARLGPAELGAFTRKQLVDMLRRGRSPSGNPRNAYGRR